MEQNPLKKKKNKVGTFHSPSPIKIDPPEESKKRKQISINKMSSSEQEATLETFNQLLDARPSIYSDPLYYNSCMSKEKDVIDTLVNKKTKFINKEYKK